MTVEQNSSGVKVWDLFIRFFHWSLVVTFVVSYLTEGEYGLHFYSGWYIGTLLLVRMVWGVIGSKYARFSDFVKPPSDILDYTKSLFSEEHQEKTYLGHNPLGGIMVVVMLLSLSFTVVSGVVLYKAEGNNTFDFIGSPVLVEIDEEQREYKEIDDKIKSLKEYREKDYEEHEDEEFWEEIHEFFSNFSLLLILFHVAGVIFSSRRENKNLVKGMITGKK